SRLIDVGVSGPRTADRKSDGVAVSRSGTAGRQPDQASCRRALETFLCDAFSPAELRQLVRYNLVLEPLTNAVTWCGSLAAVAQEVVQVLEAHGLIGTDLFVILKSERPRRAAEVEAIEKECTSRKRGPSRPAAPTAPKKRARSK